MHPICRSSLRFARASALAAILACGHASAEDVGADLAGSGFDVVSYDVRLRPDFASRSVEGTTEIKLRATAERLRAVVFTDNALTFDRIAVNGRPARVRRAGGRLKVELSKPLRAGRTITITAAYHGQPRRGVAFGPKSVHTSYFACDWTLCAQDAFGDKAMVRLALTLPEGLTSVGPGAPEPIRRLRPGETVHVWSERRPYPAYLYAFAAGDYRTVVKRTGSVELAYIGEGSPEHMERLFEPTSDMLRFFEAKAGVPFPQRRYAQLLVDGTAAQEAMSHAIIGREMIEPILATPEDDWVIAHELAHQWWGNLVTCRTLDDFWLNEGVTTFMVAAWKEHRWGRAAYDREMDLARGRLARAAAAGMNVPLTHPGPYPSLGLRRAIQYSKGALFMDALRRELGDEAFWAGLRAFTQTHAGRTADSPDIQRAFESASGRDLGVLFGQWVF